ncbi:Uncharacterised protein [uncultured archaeon]|nr:Uncharacterised protein [uncultured archaeon]
MAAFLDKSLSKELDILRKSILKDTPQKIKCIEDKEPINEESVLVTYSLPGKSRSKKMLFNYELVGRNGNDGLLQRLGGKKVTSGCAIVPADKEEEIDIFLKRHEVEFSKQRILLLEN